MNFLLLNVAFLIEIFLNLNMIHIFLVYVTGSFMSFIKAFLAGHVINQDSKIYSGSTCKFDQRKRYGDVTC